MPRNSLLLLNVTKFENSWCSWEFSKVSQKAKVAPFLSAWPSSVTTMSFGHRGCLIKNGLFWDHFEFSWKKFENRRYCFPNFSMKTAHTKKYKVYHDVADGKCHAIDTKKIFLDPSYGA